ncbi:hypothetical protein R9C00_10670 [Flammeovirgaceae bacterium SG7u.111]|nr:hypothetical protein [Flammeovirgaceae bacterium SG7u.132]WPO37915.1 hypothetical protein R9C00_10670 [Flammeovirgaceae bacterium SG7u.111]
MEEALTLSKKFHRIMLSGELMTIKSKPDGNIFLYELEGDFYAISYNSAGKLLHTELIENLARLRMLLFGVEKIEWEENEDE